MLEGWGFLRASFCSFICLSQGTEHLGFFDDIGTICVSDDNVTIFVSV